MFFILKKNLKVKILRVFSKFHSFERHQKRCVEVELLPRAIFSSWRLILVGISFLNSRASLAVPTPLPFLRKYRLAR